MTFFRMLKSPQFPRDNKSPKNTNLYNKHFNQFKRTLLYRLWLPNPQLTISLITKLINLVSDDFLLIPPKYTYINTTFKKNPEVKLFSRILISKNEAILNYSSSDSSGFVLYLNQNFQAVNEFNFFSYTKVLFFT